MERKKSKKIKTWKLVVLGILLILIIFSFYIWVSRPLKVETLDVFFSVGGTLGFDLNTSLLTFGRVLPGGSGTRKVFIENDYDFDIVVDISISNNMSEFIFSVPQVIILSNEKKGISFSLAVPEDCEFGNYSGKIKFEFKKFRS